jgi:thioredoxin reductase
MLRNTKSKGLQARLQRNSRPPVTTVTTPVAIVGAGPYGLSLAAQLREQRVPLRIFGPPMRMWSHHMPTDMHLKSDGFASDLYDTGRQLTLKRFCATNGIQYDDTRVPVHVNTFVRYGLDFQAQLVPNLETQTITRLQRIGDTFELQVETGEIFRAGRVVIATGIAYLENLPEGLAHLGEELCTHSSQHRDFAKFAGKSVIVIGSGASAVDAAAALRKVGANVTVVCRQAVRYSSGPGTGKRSLWQRIRHPHLGLGASLRTTIYTQFPNVFHFLPRSLRTRIVRRHLGPGAAYFIRPHVDGLVPFHIGYSVAKAMPSADGGVVLTGVNERGETLELRADHIVAGTGYKASIAKLPYLHPSLVASIATENDTPLLTRHFESTSVPGLYFTGLLAANSFGPQLRFAFGAKYCAKHLAAHLGRLVGNQHNAPAPLAPQTRTE